MRIVIVVLTALGVLASLFLGMKWLGDYNAAKELVESAAALGVNTAELDSYVRGAYALIAGAGIAVVGAVFALKWKGKQAAIALLVAGLLPAVFAPKALVFTFFLVLAGALSFKLKTREPSVAAA